MNRRTLLSLALGLVLLACKRHAATGDDPTVPPLQAAFDAPEGKTPCESAYNAFVALDKAAAKTKTAPPWAVFPARDEFLEACGRLPKDAQDCLVPRTSNAVRCTPIGERVKQDPDGQRFYALIKPPP